MSGIVGAARAWIGTPYVHQASTRGAGCDCLGLVRGIWREIAGVEPEIPPPYTMDWGEVGGRETLRAAALRWLGEVPVVEARAGDVLLFRMREDGVAKHLGVLSDRLEDGAFIHAYSGHGVVESPLSAPWRRRIAGVFRFPFEG